MTATAPAAPVITAQAVAPGQDGAKGAPHAPAELPAIKPVETPPSPTLVAARAAKVAADKALADAEAGKAPEPAPAAKADDPKPLPTEENPDKSWQASYATFEDPSAQAAVDLMKESGVSPIEANAFFEKAIKTGDLKDVDWAGLEQKVGKGKALLIKNGVTQYHADVYSKNQQTVTDVHAVFGGEANWTAVKTWAQTAEKTDPALKKQIDAVRTMIDQGGEIAKTGAEKLKSLHAADPKAKGLGVNKVLAGDSIPSSVEGGPLTKAEYFTQHTAAQKAGDQNLIASLRARRSAGIQAGI